MDFALCKRILDNVSRVVVGKADRLELLVVGLLAEGHVLLEDAPGLGKTLMAKALAVSIGGSFKRVQFTPDLLPSDITGCSVFNQQSAQFEFRAGPLMTHVLLADEINRTLPRTQSSLLESMEERQVTADGHTYPLPSPFFVIATQNPIELEGTYPLPEAQLDRFLLKLALGYPDRDEEIAILGRFQEADPLSELAAVTDPAQLRAAQVARRRIAVSDSLRAYIADLVRATRDHAAVRHGASPRGALALMRAGQALAAVRGRSYLLPDDVKHLASAVLGHRLVLSDAERMRGTRPQSVVQEILASTAVPLPRE
jgi:MoxR-like ATPase